MKDIYQPPVLTSLKPKENMKKELEHFKKIDPILYSYCLKLGKIEKIEKDQPQNYFYRLCREIICQQLSDKAGGAIFGRFQKLFTGSLVKPLDVLSLSHEKLRATGMSNAKARYVKNLAENIVGGDLPIFDLDLMSDQEVINELIKVKGIGFWTAEMFLMFTLAREDVFSFGDLGLKKAIMKIYGFKKEPAREKIEKIISKWSPYKTYACRLLWLSLD